MKTFSELLSTFYVAQAALAGPDGVQTMNDIFATVASSKDTDPEAARMLRVMIGLSRKLYPKELAAH